MPQWYQGGTVVHAYNKDSSNNEYYGWAKKGTLTSKKGWMICKIVYTNSNWIEHFPRVNATSKFSDTPDFEWDEVENYTYGILGT